MKVDIGAMYRCLRRYLMTRRRRRLETHPVALEARRFTWTVRERLKLALTFTAKRICSSSVDRLKCQRFNSICFQAFLPGTEAPMVATASTPYQHAKKQKYCGACGTHERSALSRAGNG